MQEFVVIVATDGEEYELHSAHAIGRYLRGFKTGGLE